MEIWIYLYEEEEEEDHREIRLVLFPELWKIMIWNLLFWGFFGGLILNVEKELLEIIIFKIIRYTSGNKLKLQESSYKNDRSNFNIFETL